MIPSYVCTHALPISSLLSLFPLCHTVQANIFSFHHRNDTPLNFTRWCELLQVLAQIIVGCHSLQRSVRTLHLLLLPLLHLLLHTAATHATTTPVLYGLTRVKNSPSCSGAPSGCTQLVHMNSHNGTLTKKGSRN